MDVCGNKGVDGGWMPLPIRPQQYCDPVSLVPFFPCMCMCVQLFLLRFQR